MALTVTSRPSKTIEGKTSTWNALNLPIQYKFESDLFPVNSVDTNYAISSFANSGGFLQVITYVGTSNILEGETVTISGCNVDSLNGVWKVKEVSGASHVLYVAYDANASTGKIQKYYNNYFAEVKVYGGLPTYHVDYASKPIQEVGTLRLIPDTDNNIIASFSGVLKSDVNVNKQLSGGIDLDHFTAFFVEWREGYDQNINNEIDTFYTSWDRDELDTCGNESITNGDFATDLSGWTQQDYTSVGDSFIQVSGEAECTLSTSTQTKVIYQEVNMVANAEYDLLVDVIRNVGSATDFKVLASNDLSTWDVLYSTVGSSSVSVVETLTPANDYKYIGFVFVVFNTVVTVSVALDNISLTSSVCDYLFWGSNSSLQFQNARGGNMYDYINGRNDSEFMTNFDTPTLFTGNYFDLSMILNPADASGLDVSDSAYMWLVASDINQADSSIVSSWVDRTGNVTVTGAVGSEPVFKDLGVNNHKGVLFSGSEYFETDSNIIQPSIVYVAFKLNDLTSNPIWDSSDALRGACFVSGVDSKIRLFNGSGDLRSNELLSGVDYILSATQNGDDSSLLVNNDNINVGSAGGNPMINIDIGYSEVSSPEVYLNGVISEIIIMPSDIDECEKWKIKTYLGNKYDTYSSNAVGYVQNEYDYTGDLINTYLEDVNYTDTGVYRIAPTVNNLEATKMDIQLVTGETCLSSRIKTININNDCSNQEIYLTWLNGLDGWDYWKFTAEKNHNLNIDSKETIKKNIFSNWDNTFINGNTQNDVIGVTAYREIDVFSQYLTLEEVKAISAIKYSIKVLAIIDGLQTTVIVDSDNITVFNDGSDDTLHTIRFKIQMPDIQSQSQ